MQATIENPQQFFNYFNEAVQQAQYPLNLIIEPVKRFKTIKQLNFIFGGLVKAMQNHYFKTAGEKWTADECKFQLYARILREEIKILPNGEAIKFQKTLSQMTLEEASEFILSAIEYLDSIECYLSVDLRFTWLIHVKDTDIEKVTMLTFPDKCPEYLSYLRKQACLHCGKPASEAHHIREHAGLALKSPDWFAVSVCKSCHDELQEYEYRLKPPYGFKDLEIFTKLCFDRWLNHR